MKKLQIHLENCYGIKALTYAFDFGAKNSYIIYSPNGTMKTSFAKSFKDFSLKNIPKDLIFPDKTTVFNIQDESEKTIPPDSIFVIEPYNQGYESDKMSTLLVNKELKNEYDKIHINIDKKKDFLLKELKQLSKLSKNIEEIFSIDVTDESNSFFRALMRLQDEVENEADESLTNVDYNILFNEKVQTFLNTKDFKEKLENYINIYDELISNSTFFSRGNFDHYNASNVEKSLKDNKFFIAKHSVYINQQGIKKEISSDKELEEAINIEKAKILDNEELKSAFSEIDKAIKNKELVEFRNYILQKQYLLPKLKNLKKLKQDIWVAYLSTRKDTYNEVIATYKDSRENLKRIAEQAEKEITKWQAIINIFNDRFYVPFNVRIDNKSDVIVGEKVPTLKFEFKDFYEEASCKIVDKEMLLNVLSQGEKRALYILNIIFEIEARKELDQKTILIIDDIADSFDYKNKYAIIEYLKEIATSDNFYQIILTHNFDFYRTTYGRLGIQRDRRLQAIRNKYGIELKEIKYQNDVFKTWLLNISKGNLEQLIALIPFIRNIAEYTLGDSSEQYKKLTSLLHIKPETPSITFSDFLSIIKQTLSNDTVPKAGSINVEDKILSNVYQVADQIEIEQEETLELEKKIVLSIATRLKSEEYMINKINNSSLVEGITKNQTATLVDLFQKQFPEDKKSLKILKRVNLMTPENIHLNSFMYEPILDMSNEHLKVLYKDIKTLSES